MRTYTSAVLCLVLLTVAVASPTSATQPPGKEWAFPTTSEDDPSRPFLLLNGRRFVVSANWTTPDGETGRGLGQSLSDDAGFFWVFDPANVEVLVKVLNACGFGNRFWVFAGGLTNVEVELTVKDTVSGLETTYENPQGTAFEPVQDTDAFATCDGEEELCEEKPAGLAAGAGNTSDFVICIPKDKKNTDATCLEYEDELLDKARDQAFETCIEKGGVNSERLPQPLRQHRQPHRQSGRLPGQRPHL